MAIRVFLGLVALVWLPYGLLCFFQPGFLAGAAGVTSTSATGSTELRAMYGGLQVAIGVLALAGALRPPAAAPALRVLAAEVRAWTPVQKTIFGGLGCDVDDDNVAFLHDPLAAACVYDESFCRFEELEIEAKIDERGVLHTIERREAGDDSFPMHCAVAVDAKRFRQHFVERVVGLDC